MPDLERAVSCSDTIDEADDLYDCVDDAEAEGDEIYEDLMRTVEQPEIVSPLVSRFLHAPPTDRRHLPTPTFGAEQVLRKNVFGFPRAKSQVGTTS